MDSLRNMIPSTAGYHILVLLMRLWGVSLRARRANFYK